ncbi:MAG TPA: Gfo/Idh/MocA family oxidoreductase [Chloroflexota bacterium]|nr:Gfo/Idh/MocA family oxidoreductase [Chloroflexota bacterium]
MTDASRQSPLRFGIAGLGIASTQIIPEFAGRPHLQLKAAADPRRAALDKFEAEFGGETYESVEEMCQSPNIDAIYVCTPNHLHAEHVITAAERGKHAIVEKPMGLTIAECEAMNEAAERNGVKLLCGHTHSFDPPVRKMREIVHSGELGLLRMISTWHFNEFMYRPRMPHELDPAIGGNIVFNQGPHQVDIVRLIGGGLVRSVRGMTGIWDPSRVAEGAFCVFLEFEDGTPATLVYNGYGHFDSAEFTEWAGEQQRDPDYNLRVRRTLAGAGQPEDEWALKEAQRYGGGDERSYRGGDRPHSLFGVTIVSCEHGDVRQTPRSLLIYGDDRKWEVPVAAGERGRAAELEELYSGVVEHRPVFHDGRWGEATLEVVLAIMQSARERRELRMSHQVAVRD